MEHKKVKIDVDIAINAYNENNPGSEKMTRERLSNLTGTHTQIFSDWKKKKGRTPNVVNRLVMISKFTGCDINDFLIEE